jgi:hypothetical protein
MGRVYSARLGQWRDLPGPVNLVNDSGQLWVIRQVLVYNGNTLEVVSFQMGDYATGATWLYFNNNVTPGTWYYAFEGRIVVPPSTEEVSNGFGWESNGFGLDVYVGGYALDLP